MSKSKSKKKLLIMGLDKSGKTSILLSCDKDTNLLSYCALKPTKGVNIEEVETPDYSLSIWDFGGQETYRKEYLENFERYINSVERIIYVIDVQDIERYEKALKYLKDILTLIKKEKLKIDFSVFLHKYDPNIKSQDKFKDIDEKINSRLIDKLKGLISPEFNPIIFKTSIYTVFEKSLLE